MKLGLCGKCRRPTESAYEIRNNCVYFVKFCPECGRTSTMVTKDAKKWLWKREITDYREPVKVECSMDCAACDHQAVTPPTTVAMDVTNVCNQHCPICLACVDAMGFTYHPPIEYFDKIFKHFLQADPKPNMCFFGGEPTMHRDFLDIVKLARSYGFQVQLFTNGIKLADRDYCEKLCSLGIQINFGFDGTRPEIYGVLRGDNSLAVKKRAFRNVIESGVNKLVVTSTVAEGVNDSNMMELIEFIHDHREHVSVWAFVPLTPCWEPGKVQLNPTTTECVERIFESNLEQTEFVPTGMMKFQILSRFFGRQTLGGSHPNCESATLFVSDGNKYVPVSAYLKKPLSELLADLRRLDDSLVGQSASIPDGGFRQTMFQIGTFLKLVRVLGGSINLRRIFGKPRILNAAKAVIDLIRGRKVDEILKQRTSFKNVLTLITIPYEDEGGLDDARLKDCPAVFAYEDMETGMIKTTAFCSWQTIKDRVCRDIQAHYDSAQPQALPKPKERVAKA